MQDGYDMLQWSVYSRITNGNDNVRKHIKRLECNLPQEGSVRCLIVSERQYASIRILVGFQEKQEKKVGRLPFLDF